MGDEAVHDCLVALEFIPDSFVTSKMINALHANKNIVFYDKDCDKVIFIADQNIFLLQILKKLVLIILMKIMLIVLFISDLG